MLIPFQPLAEVQPIAEARDALMRRDTHYLWDQNKFAIISKQNKWVIHILDNLPTTEL